MNWLKYLLLSGVLLWGVNALKAQNDEWLDDVYLSRKEVQKRQEATRQKAEAQRKLWEAEVAKERAELLKAQRSREIDAYNGILSAEDSLRIEAEAQLYARAYGRNLDELDGYRGGEYSRRLSRFYGDGSRVVINHYYGDDWAYPYWSSPYSWGRGYWGYRHYSYYDPFYYSPWEHRWAFHASWGLSPYYDTYYPPYYDAYIGIYPRYYTYWGSVAPRVNTYRGASRSASNPTHSAYGSYERSRQHNNGSPSRDYNRGYYRSNSTYEGYGRSIYDAGSRNSSYRRSSSESYRSVGSASSSSTPRGSYGGPPRSRR